MSNSLPNHSQIHETTILFRPIGPVQMRLIREANYLAFPPRLPEQPIFYPVLNEEYATQIARDWNAKGPNKKAGFVTRFRVKSDYLSRFEVHTVGRSVHQEYWIPAEELPHFNAKIVGPIEVIAEFHAK
jgi:hypothetical protein